MVQFTKNANATLPDGTVPETISYLGDGSIRQVISAAHYSFTPLSGAQYNVTCASATTLTIPSGATYGVLAIEGASVRYTVDGTTPTASIGMPLNAGQTLSLQGSATLSAFQIIQQTSSATFSVTYYK